MPQKFSWHTLTEAGDLIADMSHSEIDKLALKLSVKHPIFNFVPQGKQGPNKQAKANQLIVIARENPSHETADGADLWDAIVEQAISYGPLADYPKFVRALKRDGFDVGNDGTLRRALPEEAEIPQADDELHKLLDELGLATTKVHLDQSIKNHSDGHWAAANSQLRTFLESLFDEIAHLLAPEKASSGVSAENRRALLSKTDPPFLQQELGEWTSDGKNFVNGLFKRLHGEGSHPGLSDEEDCTFRLHLILITGRYYLRRAKEFHDNRYR